MIICCGEALIDMLPRQLPDGSDVFLPVAGGAVFNTAIALGRLGAPTGFVSGISNDMFGEQLVADLQAANVNTDLCARSGHPTTLAFAKLTGGQASYSFFDENSAGRLLDYADLPSLPGNVDALHFGGISLVPEPCGSTYEALMQHHRDNAVISLDPNIRSGFIDEPDAHRARINRMIAQSDIVKFSNEDLDWLVPGDNHEVAIADILGRGPAVVLLTRGRLGVGIFTANEEIEVEAVPVKVVDTIGAGDSFNAGILEGLRRIDLLDRQKLSSAKMSDLREAAVLATKIAALTVSKVGANPPWLTEL